VNVEEAFGMAKRTYLDSGVLLAAFKGEGELGLRALQIIDDPQRQLVVSDAVKLELLPKPTYEKRKEEVSFYCEVFALAEQRSWDSAVLQLAQNLAEQNGIAAMDAIHVAYALHANVDELITAEKPGKPMFRVTSPTIASIRD